MEKMATIMRRILKEMIISLDHGSLVILLAVVGEIHLITPRRLHKNHLLCMGMVEGNQTMKSPLFQVLVESSHPVLVVQILAVLDRHVHSILVYFLTDLVAHQGIAQHLDIVG
jgi:hypothetical protein